VTTNNVDQVFITQFQSELSQIFQTTQSKVRDAVWCVPGVTGSSYKFPTLDVATVQVDRPRNSFLAADAPTHAQVTATLHGYEVPIYLASLDEVQTNTNLRQGYQESVAAAIARSLDSAIFTQLNASNTDQGSAAAMTVAMLANLQKAAGNNSWPAGMWTLFVTPAIKAAMLNLSQVTSWDWAEGRAFATGTVSQLMGFNVVSSPELTAFGTSSTDQYMFAIHQRAVGLAFAMEPAVRIDYSPDRNSWRILGEMSAGACVIQPKGVLRVRVNSL
jgi:hypothetical protein